MTSTEPNGIASAAMSNGELTKPRDIATRSIAGVLVPDTPLISRAIEYARQHSEPYLFNHVMRSWLFAVNIAEQGKVAHDAEVLAVATLLHDTGRLGGRDAPRDDVRQLRARFRGAFRV